MIAWVADTHGYRIVVLERLQLFVLSMHNSFQYRPLLDPFFLRMEVYR